MEPNPYDAPKEQGYRTPVAGQVFSWLQDRVTELVVGLLLASLLLPIIVGLLWVFGEF